MAVNPEDIQLSQQHHRFGTALCRGLSPVKRTAMIEFVTRDDPMVQTLLRHKADHYTDYETTYFERCLTDAFEIKQQETLESGTRRLYYARSKRQA